MFNIRKRYLSRPVDRRGTVTLETAIILPTLIFIVLGAVDLGQYIHLAQTVSNSSREAGRVASRSSTESVQEVENSVRKYMAESFSNVDSETLYSSVKTTVYDEAGRRITSNQLKDIPRGETIIVDVEFAFSEIRWVVGMKFWNNKPKRTRTFCRRE